MIELQIYHIIITNILIFFIGYVLGKLSSKNSDINLKGFSRKEMKKQEKDYVKLDIDESKIVTRINTDNLEKKYNNLGNTTLDQVDISESVNKLKSMKK